MDSSARANEPNGSFLSEVDQLSGEALQNCYQCQKCSAGCPVNFAMDILPNQVFRHIQYGHRTRVLSSQAIWLCASCHACSVRCPNSIDIAKVMDTLRSMSLRSGVASGESKISTFHQFFVDLIRVLGRTWEPGFGIYKLKTGGLLGMTGFALNMFRKGKLGIVPSYSGGRKFRRLFKATGSGAAR
jgi:heterodisulfide reductase subunit C